jgi:hypothetical protein
MTLAAAARQRCLKVVWVGHSCPTPLTSILILPRTSRTYVAPWRSGASAPCKARLEYQPRSGARTQPTAQAVGKKAADNKAPKGAKEPWPRARPGIIERGKQRGGQPPT